MLVSTASESRSDVPDNEDVASSVSAVVISDDTSEDDDAAYDVAEEEFDSDELPVEPHPDKAVPANTTAITKPIVSFFFIFPSILHFDMTPNFYNPYTTIEVISK